MLTLKQVQDRFISGSSSPSLLFPPASGGKVTIWCIFPTISSSPLRWERIEVRVIVSLFLSRLMSDVYSPLFVNLWLIPLLSSSPLMERTEVRV
jgi:hypothetical protein